MRWGQDRFEQLQRARADTGARKQALSERLKQSAAERSALAEADAAVARRFSDIDVEAALAFASSIGFQRFDLQLEDGGRLNRPTVEMLRHFLLALTEQHSAAVLQWPSGQRDAAILHPLAMLAILGCRPAIVGKQHRWCAAVPDIRTLYFPYRGGGTGSGQRNWLVDRDRFLGPNRLHQTRTLLGQSEASEPLKLLHNTLGHLDRLKLRDATAPHLAHPTLAELYPVFAAEGDGAPFAAARHELFGRVRYGAAIDRLTDHRGVLADPAQAPFGLFGIDARANLRAALTAPALLRAKGGRPPDLCLLDLNPPGLNRLGPEWEEILSRFLDCLLGQYPALPILAITHDGYVQRRLAALFARSKSVRMARRAPLAMPAILRRSVDMVTDDPPVGEVTPISALFQSTAGASVTALAALADAARAMPDAVARAAIRRSAANLRRAAALPCGLGAAYEWLCELEGQAVAEAFLDLRSEASVLGAVQQAIATGIGGSVRSKLLEAETAIGRAYAQLQDDTPIGSAVAELAALYARKSDFSVLVFATELDLKLAKRRFAAGSAIGEGLAKRLAKDQLRICHAGELEAVLAELETGGNRSSWRRLALVAPPIAFLDRLLLRPWLPDHLLVICDRAFTGRVAGTYAPLSSHSDFAGDNRIGARMAILAEAAKKEAVARAVGPLSLVLEERPAIDARDDLIDLAASDEAPGEALRIALASGRTLRLRPGSAVIRHDRDAPVNPFERALARELGPGDIVVVPDRAFVDEARRLLPVELLARGWVKMFHDLIVAALETVPGATFAAKARTVHAALQAHPVRATSLGAVQEWLNAEAYRNAPAEQMRPHAPQVRGDFDALLAVLQIPPGLADKMWDEGIEQLRSDKRRAGVRMAQAFISVLVDPHGVAGALSADVRRRIGQLRVRALDHLDAVRTIEQESDA